MLSASIVLLTHCTDARAKKNRDTLSPLPLTHSQTMCNTIYIKNVKSLDTTEGDRERGIQLVADWNNNSGWEFGFLPDHPVHANHQTANFVG